MPYRSACSSAFAPELHVDELRALARATEQQPRGVLIHAAERSADLCGSQPTLQ
ncbi:MAG: hypothetical protein WDO12_13090 [Pseudomonadota bacterium]